MLNSISAQGIHIKITVAKIKIKQTNKNKTTKLN